MTLTAGSNLQFCGLPGLWLEGEYNPEGWLYTGGSAGDEKLSLAQLWKEMLPDVPLPYEADIQLWGFDIELFIGHANEAGKRDYRFMVKASVEMSLNAGEDFESKLLIEHIELAYERFQKTRDETHVKFDLLAAVSLDQIIEIPDAAFQFSYDRVGSEAADWKIGGQLTVLTFDRLMTFKAEAASMQEEQSLLFGFDATQAGIHQSLFRKLEDPEEIMLALNGGSQPENQFILLSTLPEDLSERLSTLEEAQKKEVLAVVRNKRRAMGPLIEIPDLLNQPKTLCSVNPKSFEIKLTRKNQRFNSLDLSIGGDLVVYNTWVDQGTWIQIQEGKIELGYNRSEASAYLRFTAKETTIQPLQLIGMIPGVSDLLMNSFGETAEQCPKTSALLNLLSLRPGDFEFVKKNKDWNLKASVKLVMSEALKYLDEDLFLFIDKVFPKVGDDRFLSGALSYDSGEGLYVVFENNNGLEIGNLLGEAIAGLDPEFKANVKANLGVDLDVATDLGESFVLLERIRVLFAKEIKLDFRVAIGLPSRLNDRLFNPESKLHGFVKVYDRKKLSKPKNELPAYNAPLPNDGLLHASLSFGTDGIGGQLDQFDLFNWEKLSEEFAGFYKDETDAVVLDFSALLQTKKPTFSKIRIEKPIFKLDFKTCSFHITGGIKLESDTINFPVRPLLKKLIGLLPPTQYDIKALNELADQFTEQIGLTTMHFYDPQTGEFKLDDFDQFIRQFLPAAFGEKSLIPNEISQLLKQHSGQVAQLLPDMLLSYLNIAIPTGFKFNLEITSDQSIAFAFAVADITPEQRDQGLVDYIQFMMPQPSMPPLGLMGIRFKKIGFGTGLFSQAFRLDLSTEMTMIPFHDILAGIGFGILRQQNPADDRLQHYLPDPNTFGSRMKIENLLMLIFPQTQIPIPVPVFYDQFELYGNGVFGAKTHTSISFPRPAMNIKDLLLSLGDLLRFFKEPEYSLPIPAYGITRSPEESLAASNLPVFAAGPFYAELPGFIGTLKTEDQKRKPIVLGFKDQRVLNPKEMAALILNSGKTGLRSILQKKYLKIRIDENREAYPLTYLLQYTPENQRMGAVNIILFEIFEANFIWALASPAEFKTRTLPLLIAAQEEMNRDFADDHGGADSILKLVPGCENWTSETDGMVSVLKAGIRVHSSLNFDLFTATAFTVETGFSTGFSLRGRVANLFGMKLGGHMKVNPSDQQKPFELGGAAQFLLFEKYLLMQGSFNLQIGSNSAFKVQTLLDLFPDVPGVERSPVQLYTGGGRGRKEEMTGYIAKDGVRIGTVQHDGTVTPTGIHLEIGDMHLGGTVLLIAQENRHELEIKFHWGDTEIGVTSHAKTIENGEEWRLAVLANKPIGLENIVVISGIHPGTGMSGDLVLHFPNGGMPFLYRFTLDAQLSLFGLTASTTIHISPQQFSAVLQADLGILKTNLNVRGGDLGNLSTFNLDGNISVLSSVLNLSVNASYKADEHGNKLFIGTGDLTFWDMIRMNMEIHAGVQEGVPHIGLWGMFNFQSPDGAFHLHSGHNALVRMEGVLSGNDLKLDSAITLYLLGLRFTGGLRLRATPDRGLHLEGEASFTAGLLGGGNFNYKFLIDRHLLKLSADATAGITLWPGVIELGGNSHIDVHINLHNNTPEHFELGGSVQMMGISSSYKLQIQPHAFFLTSSLETPVFDATIRLNGTSLTDLNSLRVSGGIDLVKLNQGINDFFARIGLRSSVQGKLDGLDQKFGSLQGQAQNASYIAERVNFIRYMNEKWKNNWEWHGFPYCVPPPFHMDYWSKHAWGGRNPYYSRQDYEDCEKYYRFKRELGLGDSQPNRNDIVNFFRGFFAVLNDQVFHWGNDISNALSGVVRDVSNLVGDVLRHLNIDTKDLNELVRQINNGIGVLDEQRRKWRDLNHRVLNNNFIEIEAITFADLPIASLENKQFSSTVTFKILGDRHVVNADINLNDPVTSIVNCGKQFLPGELQALF